MSVVAYVEEGNRSFKQAELDKLPDRCPHCNIGVSVEPIQGHLYEHFLQVTCKCPMNGCKRIFIATYGTNPVRSIFVYIHTTPRQVFNKQTFDDNIEALSPDFVNIYNQAYDAEQSGLDQICGMGYRKALEFLIKDYLISRKPEDKDNIIKKTLGNCIDQDIDDVRIKSMSKRATWLGNDETHYSRKHEEMNVKDLKRLIEVTQHWIVMDFLTIEYEEKLQ